MSILNNPKLESLLANLHARSDAQTAAIETSHAERARQRA